MFAHVEQLITSVMYGTQDINIISISTRIKTNIKGRVNVVTA